VLYKPRHSEWRYGPPLQVERAFVIAHLKFLAQKYEEAVPLLAELVATQCFRHVKVAALQDLIMCQYLLDHRDAELTARQRLDKELDYIRLRVDGSATKEEWRTPWLCWEEPWEARWIGLIKKVREGVSE
jgi:hypothetical protein